MAKLINCSECNQKISIKAKICPHCGAPNKHRPGGCGSTLLITFLLFVFFVAVFSYDDSPKKKSSIKPLAATKEVALDDIDYNANSLSEFNLTGFTDDKDSILLAVAFIDTWSKSILDAYKFDLSETEKKKVDDFKKKLAKFQVRSFPILRDRYGPAVRSELWENDMSAKTYGAGYRTIDFVGGAFAANRNIKTWQTELIKSLKQLRFKKAMYKWNKHQDRDITYYEIKTYQDSDIVYWGSSYKGTKID